MEHQIPTQNAPSTISELLKYTIDENFNVEDGLCQPNNENLFLISSIAFLQKQLERKTGKNIEVAQKQNVAKRKCSDLLLVESGTKSKREKCFIRLPNLEKFDEILKKEACLPVNTLSNSQILPLPKSRPRRLPIPNLFKTKLNSGTIQNSITKPTHSLFNIFRKNPSTNYCSEATIKLYSSDASSIESEADFSQNNYMVVNKNERKFICSPCQPNSNSTVITDISIPTSLSMPEIDMSKGNCSMSCISSEAKLLTNAEKEILKVIPSESSIATKKSINRRLRIPQQIRTYESNTSQTTINFIIRDDYYEDPETGIKFKCIPKGTSKSLRVKEQQSKLSVCIEEEETESEMETYTSSYTYPYNCTDDVKTMVPTETLDVIIHQLLRKSESNCV